MSKPKELVKATLVIWYDPDKHGVTGEADTTLDIVRSGGAHTQLVDCEIVKNYESNKHWKKDKHVKEELEEFFHVHEDED